MSTRNKELRLLTNGMYMTAGLTFLTYCSPYLVSKKKPEIFSNNAPMQLYNKTEISLKLWYSFRILFFLFQVSIATFTVYVLTGNELTATKAFVAISLFNILRFPLLILPRVIVNFVQVTYCFSVSPHTACSILYFHFPHLIKNVSSQTHTNTVADCKVSSSLTVTRNS